MKVKLKSILEHLIICPRGGICNRLRAIASAKRLSALNRARFTINWDWGDFDQLFKMDQSVSVIHRLPADIQNSGCSIRHLHALEGGNHKNRKVPIHRHRIIILTSNYAFNASTEKERITEYSLKNWLPIPAEHILKTVAQFKAAHFTQTVGMHIRRADNALAIKGSPDQLFMDEAKRLIDSGYNIFLATDNDVTTRMMIKKFGRQIIIYPKNPELMTRWPRSFNFQDTVDDLVDLHLLANCQFVVGTEASSFSRLAIAYNGSSSCKILS